MFLCKASNCFIFISHDFVYIPRCVNEIGTKTSRYNTCVSKHFTWHTWRRFRLFFAIVFFPRLLARTQRYRVPYVFAGHTVRVCMYIPLHTRCGFGSLPVAGEATFVSVKEIKIYTNYVTVKYKMCLECGMGGSQCPSPLCSR